MRFASQTSNGMILECFSGNFLTEDGGLLVQQVMAKAQIS
jgi:hypothetical protein